MDTCIFCGAEAGPDGLCAYCDSKSNRQWAKASIAGHQLDTCPNCGAVMAHECRNCSLPDIDPITWGLE